MLDYRQLRLAGEISAQMPKIQEKSRYQFVFERFVRTVSAQAVTKNAFVFLADDALRR